jgi:hypothetical protein
MTVTAQTIAACVFVVDRHNLVPGGSVTTKHCHEHPRLVRVEHYEHATGILNVACCVDGRRADDARQALTWLNAPAPEAA